MAKKAKAKKSKCGISHHIHKCGVGRGVKRRFVPRDIITIPWGKPVCEREILGWIKSGYEVRIGSMKSGIRLFPYLNTDFKTQRVVAQTHGDFREAIKDAPWNESGKVTHNLDEMVDITSRRNNFTRDGYSLAKAGVTPDTMVECPNCGTTFRVGKKLV